MAIYKHLWELINIADIHNRLKIEFCYIRGGIEIVDRIDIHNNLTKEEQFLIYLSDYNENHLNYFAPELLTLKYIQKELNCSIGLLHSIVNKNLKEGSIYRKKMRIENNKRKQYVNFLTEKGIEFVRKIRSNYQ